MTKKKRKVIPKKDVINIIRQLFKNMIHGVTYDRLIVQMEEKIMKVPVNFINTDAATTPRAKDPSELKDKKTKKFDVNQDMENNFEYQTYKKLVEQTYDPTEYRLPLWLPLTLDQKLDMLLHQRISEEVEMMQFLIDEEQGCGLIQQAPNLKKYEEVDKKLERALDGLIFEKYMMLTRIQAINQSKMSCDNRMGNRKEEEEELMTYANWLTARHQVALQLEQSLKQEIKQQQLLNQALLKKLQVQMLATHQGRR